MAQRMTSYIEQLLGKLQQKEVVKKRIAEIILSITKVPIEPKNISAKNGVLFIKESGMRKQEIVINKEKIIEQIQKETRSLFLDIK